MKKNLKSFFKGFSLVELMISLITISLISAAFAPIITKKLSSMGITVGSLGGNGGGGGSEEINCPSNITCEAGYYLDGTCKCQPCSDSNCTYCAHNICSICNDGFTLINGKCENKACHDSGGLPTKACCESVGAMFIDRKYIGNTDYDLCMMKFNAGDDENTYNFGTTTKIYHPNYPKIGVQMNQVGVSCTSTGNCCWKGNTSTATNSYLGYSAANRTACQQKAATKICNNWAFGGSKQGSWRLMTKAEANKLANAITAESDSNPVLTKYLTSKGLQLCDRSSNTKGSNKCVPLSVCKGAYANNCYIHELVLSGANEMLTLINGTADVTTDKNNNVAYSTRCVTSNVNEVVSPIDTETTSHNDVEPRNQDDCPNGTLYINKKFLGGGSNLCVMQYNATDDVYKIDGKAYHVPYTKLGVKVVDTNTNCNTGSCCWKGNTSNGAYSSPDFNVNYSPSNRSACQEAAATEICKNWAFGNSKPGHWRLMTKTEATELAKYINVDGYYPESESFAFFTRYLNNEGLQLCDRSSNTMGSNKCAPLSACKGAYSNNCYISELILSEKKAMLTLIDGIAAVSTDPNDNVAYSIRCVSDTVEWAN